MPRTTTHARRSSSITAALRLAPKSWRLQYRDSGQSFALAEQALARATAIGDLYSEGWARLTRGFHRMRYATPAETVQELASAQHCFEATQDRTGQILATVGIGRSWWITESIASRWNWFSRCATKVSVWYEKDSLVMYALKDYLGEERLNLALRNYLDGVRFRRTPYRTADDFINALRDASPPELKSIITDMFETITLFDKRAIEASWRKTPKESTR